MKDKTEEMSELVELLKEYRERQRSSWGCEGIYRCSTCIKTDKLLSSLPPSGPTAREPRKEFMDKLAEIMPKKPEPDNSNIQRIAQINHEPIRRASEAFTGFMNGELPRNVEELVAMLWVFGEVNHGHLEKTVATYSKLANDAIALQLKPTIFPPSGAASESGETAFEAWNRAMKLADVLTGGRIEFSKIEYAPQEALLNEKDT